MPWIGEIKRGQEIGYKGVLGISGRLAWIVGKSDGFSCVEAFLFINAV